MMGRTCAVTGGAGFIGAFLVRHLLQQGWDVIVIDNMTRGAAHRLADVMSDIRLEQCDIRDAAAVTKAITGCDVVFHLAAVNGTENFYKHPELVLDVGLRGILSVVEACRKANVPDLVAASSAEVYQTPPVVPTPEAVALSLPDSLNPRYSYGGSKIITELVAFNYGQDHFRRVQVFRPHNVYGPDMGYKHVVPQFILRALEARGSHNARFQIQGTGAETRAFAYVDDVVEGILRMYEKGENRSVYHIGNDEEVSIRDLAHLTGKVIGFDLDVVEGPLAEGGTPRRCPDIQKMRSLGYAPAVNLEQGLRNAAQWYEADTNRATASALM